MWLSKAEVVSNKGPCCGGCVKNFERIKINQSYTGIYEGWTNRKESRGQGRRNQKREGPDLAIPKSTQSQETEQDREDNARIQIPVMVTWHHSACALEFRNKASYLPSPFGIPLPLSTSWWADHVSSINSPSWRELAALSCRATVGGPNFTLRYRCTASEDLNKIHI